MTEQVFSKRFYFCSLSVKMLNQVSF